MVTEQVAGLHAATHRHARATGVVVPPGGYALLSDRRAVVALVSVADVDGGHPAHRGLDALAVAVVDIGGVHTAARDAGHVVLHVVGQGHVLVAVDAPSSIMGLTDSPVCEAHDACFRQWFSHLLLVFIHGLFEGVDQSG